MLAASEVERAVPARWPDGGATPSSRFLVQRRPVSGHDALSPTPRSEQQGAASHRNSEAQSPAPILKKPPHDVTHSPWPHSPQPGSLGQCLPNHRSCVASEKTSGRNAKPDPFPKNSSLNSTRNLIRRSQKRAPITNWIQSTVLLNRTRQSETFRRLPELEQPIQRELLRIFLRKSKLTR